jgi:hypothetical protein
MEITTKKKLLGMVRTVRWKVTDPLLLTLDSLEDLFRHNHNTCFIYPSCFFYPRDVERYRNTITKIFDECKTILLRRRHYGHVYIHVDASTKIMLELCEFIIKRLFRLRFEKKISPANPYAPSRSVYSKEMVRYFIHDDAY